VTNTNLHPISYRFEVIADYCSNFGQKPVTLYFWSPFEGLSSILGSLQSS